MEPLNVFALSFFPPSASVVWENTATLFYCEAPEMFHGPKKNFTRLFHLCEGE